ncbi:MAG: branched-chain amino acid ABC transporter substrate-binding protein [Hyphomicrobium sp.]|nr:branched-chain amino acid ABC transporter substrate-binding protein [Hyphomicrobium sp.]PPD05904.1 MAG: branched-chain amino acid ABC transporter substrate-binding protein [Hyphomicrobium sp.]
MAISVRYKVTKWKRPVSQATPPVSPALVVRSPHKAPCHSLRALGHKSLGLFAVVASLLAPAAVWAGGPPGVAPAETAPAAEAPADVKTLTMLMVRQLRPDRLPPLSLLDLPPKDDGLAGARLAIDDNNTTGRFLKQNFTLELIESEDPAELIAETKKRVEGGLGFIVTDLDAKPTIDLADALKGLDAVIFNTSAPDENIREEDCRANLKHTAPSRAMLSDALSQYLAWKRWGNWVLITGPTPEDKAFAEALRRSAQRFGMKIVEEREFKYDPGSRRSDGGFEQIQQQIPTFTQKLPPHDVLVVADEGELFGEYFPYRTWDAKPVVGTAGLFPTSWHPAIELWGGTQFQNRFKRLANRTMRPLDYNAWIAVRSIGEAATRKQSVDRKALIDYMLSPEFELAAFKGRKLTYRAWNGQLRQPLVLATGKMHVTVSPQPGFLHQFTELDTLGIDRPETKCRAYQK